MKSVKIIISVILIASGGFLWKKGYDMGNKPIFIGMVGFSKSEGTWKGDMMTMDEYERYIETELKEFDKAFEWQTKSSAAEKARKKLNKAQSKRFFFKAGGTIMSLTGIGLLISVWLLKTKPEKKDEGLA